MNKHKQFIKDAYDGKLDLTMCSEWKEAIENAYPEFKVSKLEVGKWYFRGKELSVWNDGQNTYGFNDNGIWTNNMCFSTRNLRPATDKEVEQTLIAEAKKRGFKEGVRFNSVEQGHISGFKFVKASNRFGFQPNSNRLHCNGYTAFFNGKWAEIIEETITKQEAEKLLGKTII